MSVLVSTISYNNIKFQQISVAALNPYAGTQMVNIGLKLIKCFSDFEKGLISWFKRPVVEHTLINLKILFEIEYQALRRVRGTKMRNTAYFQQANALSSVMEKIKEERELTLTEVKDSEYKIIQAMQVSDNITSPEDRDDISTPCYSIQSANSALSDSIQLEILKSLKEMRDKNFRGNNKRSCFNRNNNNNSNFNNNKKTTTIREEVITTIVTTTTTIITSTTKTTTTTIIETTTTIIKTRTIVTNTGIRITPTTPTITTIIKMVTMVALSKYNIIQANTVALVNRGITIVKIVIARDPIIMTTQRLRTKWVVLQTIVKLSQNNREI